MTITPDEKLRLIHKILDGETVVIPIEAKVQVKGRVIYQPHFASEGKTNLFQAVPCETCGKLIEITLDGTPVYSGQLFGFIRWCKCEIVEDEEKQ